MSTPRNDDTVSPHSTHGTPKKKLPWLKITIPFAVLIALYLGFSAFLFQQRHIAPNTSVLGVDLSGRTFAEAEVLIATAVDNLCADLVVPVACGNGDPILVPGSALSVDAAAVATQVMEESHRGGLLGEGFVYLTSLLGEHTVDVPLVFTDRSAIDQIEAQVYQPLCQTNWYLVDDALTVVNGKAGQSIDRSGLEEDILRLFAENKAVPQSQSGSPLLTVSPLITEPNPVDWDKVADEIFVQPQDAYLDATTKTIIPHVDGISFDTAVASEILTSAAEGEVCTVPLVYTEPTWTTQALSDSLFTEVLGQATSLVSGTYDRKANVKTSAASCNEIILMPGEIFSYNNATGSRTVENGYLIGTAYIGGQSVEQVGGGVCQTSSTLYYAALNANLEIVERHSHAFAVGYVPNGMDSTVWYGSLDFRFANNTNSPMKIVTNSYTKNWKTYLTVTYYGTKVDDTYVTMTHTDTNYIPWVTVYTPDENIPAGTTEVSVTPYTGVTATTYRNIYSADDELISSTVETISNYKKRDKVILFNPADAASLGLDPVTGEEATETTVYPEVDLDVTPDDTQLPDDQTSPESQGTPAPEVTPTPETTPAPEVTPAPETTPAPEVTPTPETTPAPEVTPAPETTPAPEVTPTPETTPVPETTPAPQPEVSVSDDTTL